MSELTQYLKAAKILKADQMLSDIRAICFKDMKKEARASLMRDIKQARVLFLEKAIKSYKEVVNSLTSRLTRG